MLSLNKIYGRQSGILRLVKMNTKTEYIKKFYEFCRKNKIVYHSLILYKTVKVVQIINKEK